MDGYIERSVGRVVDTDDDGVALMSYLKSMPASSLSVIEVAPIASSTYAGEGNFWVVDIKLKKRPDDGVSGMANINSAQAHANSQSASINLDIRKRKVGINASAWASNNNGKSIDRQNTIFTQQNSNTISNTKGFNNGQSYGANIRLDYDISDRQVIGFFVNADFGSSKNRSHSISQYGNNAYTAIDSIYQNNIHGQTYNRNVSANLNYQINTDNKGSGFTVDADYLNHLNVAKQNSIFDRVSSDMVPEYTLWNLFQRTPQAVSAWSGRAAYNHVFGRWGTLMVGADAYSTVSDDDSYYANGAWEDKDLNLSNHFVFTEVISSLFASYTTQWLPKLSTTVGGKMQYTYTKGDQRTTGEVFHNYKLRFLPSAYISYNPTPDHSLSYSIANNVEHPGYKHMNSFRTYSSPTSYSVGDYTTTAFALNLYNTVTISRKHNIFLSMDINFTSPMKSAIISRPANYYVNASLTKRFNNLTLMVYANDILRTNTFQVTRNVFGVVSSDYGYYNAQAF